MDTEEQPRDKRTGGKEEEGDNNDNEMSGV
jgi:hypothetical protein